MGRGGGVLCRGTWMANMMKLTLGQSIIVVGRKEEAYVTRLSAVNVVP